MAEGKSMTKWIGVALAVVLVVLAVWGGCSCGKPDCTRALAGTWQGSFMTLSFTFPPEGTKKEKGQPIGQIQVNVLGSAKDQPLVVQECSDDKVVFTLGDTWATASMKNKNTMSLSQSGLPAATLKRVKK